MTLHPYVLQYHYQELLRAAASARRFDRQPRRRRPHRPFTGQAQ